MADFPPDRLNQVHHGDCYEVLKTFPDESIDAVVTDPPYGLGTKEPTGADIIRYIQGERLDTGGDFMGKSWELPPVAVWKECFRVLKPGGYVLSFAGTRTHDIMSIGLRTAGFESRDTIADVFGPNILLWMTGQGFPKSLNVSKAIDKMKGATRKVVGVNEDYLRRKPNGMKTPGSTAYGYSKTQHETDANITEPATDDAKKWEGYGTALKPAWEPILCFRKPIVEKNVAAQMIATGTGAMNIDGARVKHASAADFEKHKAMVDRIKEKGGSMEGSWKNSSDLSGASDVKTEGRWPPNVTLTHAPGCLRVGEHKIDAPTINRFTDGMKPFGGGAGHEYETVQTGDADGKEEVPLYLCVDGCPIKALDAQSGVTKSSDDPFRFQGVTKFANGGRGEGTYVKPGDVAAATMASDLSTAYGDKGGASRYFPNFEAQATAKAPFFYTPKAPKKDKNKGLKTEKVGKGFLRLRSDLEEGDFDKIFDAFPERDFSQVEDFGDMEFDVNDVPKGIRNLFEEIKPGEGGANSHVTVKPIALMKWLVSLVTPRGAIVLDPYCGSGTTCLAAAEMGCKFVGIEKDDVYFGIATKRAEEANNILFDEQLADD